jgi:hypothetical protein
LSGAQLVTSRSKSSNGGGRQFDPTDETSQAVYRAGQDAATAFLDTWDFEAYKTTFRSG